jgi:membrane-associated protease RseP (regulator of RpoE activity)
MVSETQTLTIIIAGWIVFYFLAKQFKLEEKGWEIQPYYALYKSTRLNGLIHRIANMSPRFWKILGNIGIAASVGQVSFISYILVKNLWSFVFKPEQAAPIQPLIPGVTISINSLPWFLLGAGIVLLTHELGHGLMCITENVPVKTSAIMLAVITFGGAVEPEEEAIKNADIMSKMRIYAIGSVINLLTGLLIIPIFIIFGESMPVFLIVFFNWVYFVSINLSMMNMLPIGPLDGGQMWREFTNTMKNGKTLQVIATYGYILIILGNITLSLAKFGFIPI